MRARIKTVFNSTFSEIALLVITCVLVTMGLAKNGMFVSSDMEIGVGIAAGILIFAWLAWCTYMIATGKPLREMPPRPRIVMESCTRLLLIFWVYLIGGAIMAAILAIFILWDGVRSLRDAFPSPNNQ